MAKLGDSGGTFTWMRYRRWPFFALMFGIIAGIIGAIFFGLEGLLIGLVGGGFLGIILGLLMGKDRKMFPVEIHKILSYSSGNTEFGGKFPGRVVTQTFTGDTGAFVERRIVEYLENGKLRQLPNFSLPVWFKDGQTRKLVVLQIDSFTFLPITYERGAMIAHDVPVYRMDENGRVVTFKVGPDGKFITNKVVDAEGKEKLEFVPDPAGRPLVVGFTTQTVFNPNIMVDEEGGVVSIPKGMAARMDNERVQYTQSYRIASEFNKLLGFWNKYGNMLVAALCIMGCLMIGVYTLITFRDISGTMAGAYGQPIKDAAASNLIAAQINAEVTQSLLKMGFNYNGSIICKQVGLINGTNTALATPIPSLNIPFVGGS